VINCTGCSIGFRQCIETVLCSLDSAFVPGAWRTLQGSKRLFYLAAPSGPNGIYCFLDPGLIRSLLRKTFMPIRAPRDSEWATHKLLIDKRLRAAGWRVTPYVPVKGGVKLDHRGGGKIDQLVGS
jgi:hypothetical protein